MLIYFVANWYTPFPILYLHLILTHTPRAVKMSILALYYRIGYGKQGLPWIVQSRAILITAGSMTAFSLAVFFVRTSNLIPFSHLPP
jgi:hypothetical protein